MALDFTSNFVSRNSCMQSTGELMSSVLFIYLFIYLFSDWNIRRKNNRIQQKKRQLEFGMYPQSMPTEWTHARTLRPWQSVRLDL